MPTSPAERERRGRALAVLQDADRLLEGWSCCGSAECCRFGVTGREPWLTEAEWSLLAAEVARQGRRLPPAPRGAAGDCPFLGPDARCTVYAARPLGCRTFWCDRASGPGYPRREISRLPAALDALSRRPSREDDGRARPLTSWLRRAS